MALRSPRSPISTSQTVTPEMTALLRALRKKVVIGVVGGSDFVKVEEQVTPPGSHSKLSRPPSRCACVCYVIKACTNL